MSPFRDRRQSQGADIRRSSLEFIIFSIAEERKPAISMGPVTGDSNAEMFDEMDRTNVL